MDGESPFSLLLLLLLPLLLLADANLHLFPSDHQSLSHLQKHLHIRVNGQLPCNSAAGVTFSNTSTASALRITRIKFDSRRLAGTLSPAIGKLSELRELSLSGNLISGDIPPEIGNCWNLEVLDLKNNRFSGKVPPEISSLVHLRVLDLSSNGFSGELNFLKHFINLEKLFLSNNMFSGKVPETLRSFLNLRVLDISGNRLLQGSIPVLNQVEYLSVDLGLTDKDQVPRRYILAENTTSSALAPASSSTSQSQISAPAPAPTPTTQNHKKKRNTRKMIVGFFVGSIAGILCGILLSIIYKLIMYLIWGGEKDPGPAIYSPMIKKSEDLAFLEGEDGVSSLEIIGRGGCGVVYKSELPGSNGMFIAIKKVIQPPRPDSPEITDEETKFLNKFLRQVKSEIQTVGHVRHRNLLPLLAHVARPDCHYLVYEYMKNGSLQDILDQVSCGTRELDWITRHNIALGVASGLEYLHMNQNLRIIHRDLKPANILLDDNMEGKITDFGLAKVMPNFDTHVTASNVAGTVGYIAPEYHQTLKFTDKCDVYSFGVVLGVLVIGKLPSDEFFQTTTEMSLVKWMKNVMTSTDPTVAIDPKLIGNGYEEQMLLVLKIACFCTLEDPKQRPNSKDVRCMLSQILN